MENNVKSTLKLRQIFIIIITLIVIATITLFWINAFRKGDIAGGGIGIIISVTMLAYLIYVFQKGNKDIRAGYPLEDERSKRVKEKASSRAFYTSLYLLLLAGLLSGSVLKFSNPSQAITASVGLMSLLFAAFWLFYNKKEI